MNAIKSFVRGALRQRGYELCQVYDSERAAVPQHATFSYREVQCYRAICNPGQLSLEESRLLSELVRASDSERPIIEIGTLFGYSTTVITLAKKRSQRLITVDNYCWNPLGISPETHFQITKNRLREATESHAVEMLRMDKAEFYRTYAGPPPSVFFCDADHSYEATKADIEWARSVGASVICGDDYDLPHEPGTARAVDELGRPKRPAGGLFVM